MIPASSNSLTVRYTVEIEILSSTATQRRYESSTSGWWAASASTRAMTRRCSVMRMPVAAQRASIPEALSAGVDFSAVMCFALGNSASSTNLERFQAKWKPVRVKKTRQIKNLEPRFDSIETEKAPGSCFERKWRLRAVHGEARL